MNHIHVQNIKVENDKLSGPLGAAFLLLISKIYFEKAHISNDNDYPRDYTPQLLSDTNPIVDIIIVGAGPAGCVLANRLSQIENWKILLLEAGKEPSDTSEVPAFYHYLRSTNEDWNFITQKENAVCQGFKDQRCKIFRGRTLGGSSSINNLHYLKALPMDFNSWPSEDSGDGWTQDVIAQNYKKHEARYPKSSIYEDYGLIGELGLDNLNGPNDLKDLIYDAAEKLGYEKVKPGQYLGYFDVLGTVRDGARENYAKAFLKPIKHRSNLGVARNIRVTKVLTKYPVDKRISGVEAYVGKRKITIKAKKEVILTSGAINTAQLLMLSGFGPKEHLKRFNISVLADLPVGKNLQDQVATYLFVGIDKGVPAADNDDVVDDMYSFMMHRKGAFTHTNINDLVGFINTKNESDTKPNLIIYHYYFPKNDKGLYTYLKNLGFVDKIASSIYKYNKEENLILFMPTLIKPKSRGEIELQSDNPFKRPFIMGNFLLDHENDDFQTLLSGAKYIMALIETEPFKKRDARFLEVDMPNCRNFKYCNEPYLGCAVRNMAAPRSQVIGTAIMGNIKSCKRVTNEFLLLDGMRHLRIVDGSVIPEGITGNLEPTVAMMAENVADQIRKKWNV